MSALTREQEIYRDSFVPGLICFTDWVLKSTKLEKITKLYFLARDAYMSYLTAKKLVAKYNLDIECRYLEGSRFAWRMAEYHLLSDDEILAKICIGGVHVTLRKILSRGGLISEEIEECADRIGRIAELDRQLSYSEAVRYRQILKNDIKLVKIIKERSKLEYEKATQYFRQEGLYDIDKVCIVDSGWVGSMQQTLSRLIERKVEGYYFGLYELPRNVDRERYHTFFFEPYKDIEKKVHFNNCVFETIFTSGEGMTIGYEEVDGKIIAIKETEKNPNKERIIGNIEILNSLLDDSTYLDKAIKISPKKALAKMQRVMVRPTKEEAECIGSYLFSDDVNQDSIQEIAVPMTIREVKNTHAIKRILIMTGRSKSMLKDSAWLEGSIVRCGENVGYHLWHCRWYKRLIYLRKIRKK